MRKLYLSLIPVLIICGCTENNRLFDKVDSDHTGIDFKNEIEESDDFNIIDYLYFFNGGGVATGDVNGDGLVDIFFSGNQVKNRLYLNKGNFQFEDVTELAGVAGESDWNTGSVMADINGDGLLDIYVCAVVGLKGLRGHNELYINNGDTTFSEQSAEYGLDFDSYSSTAAFLDYDLDGDLDMYLLNHAVHTQESFGRADLRKRRTYETGDKLLRNDNGSFVEVSEDAGIYGGINGYGLGISVADFNNDNFPDIYVGNDFHEDDYFYINNGDGTFREDVKEAFTQVSRFSMGNDIADVNHDGFTDLISLDMLAEDEEVLKKSEGDERLDILKLRIREYGYHYQFARNMLQLNNGNGTFSETGIINGISATDWSWSALFSDYDLDGHIDLFVANGIPRRPNDLDYIKFVSSDQIRNTIDATNLVDKQALDMMPSGKVKNKIFRGNGDGSFVDMTNVWLNNDPSFSTAVALGDFDNDGDQDMVINNVNSPAEVYQNNTNGKANFLKIRFKYHLPNAYGIGTKAFVYTDGELQYKELYAVKGFQSSSEPLLYFGLGASTKIDSIKIVWPNGSHQLLLDSIVLNQIHIIEPRDNKRLVKPKVHLERKLGLFKQIDPMTMGISFSHKEDRYSDFDRLKLLPYQQSDRGPATAIGDLNGDGKKDIYFGGSKYVPGSVYLQVEGGFLESKTSIRHDSIQEEVDAVISDFDQNGQADILIATGGADFYGPAEPLLDRLYLGFDSLLQYRRITLPDVYDNAGCINKADYNSDGFPDVFIGNQSVSNDFGRIPSSVLLRNNRGKLEAVQEDLFGQLGMVTDACWVDYNQDGNLDLVVVGEWMSPIFLANKGGKFVKDEVLESSEKGLWQSIMPYDIDRDGDMDFLLGNWGLNSKFIASKDFPMLMYYGDLDANGSTETIVAIQKNGKYYPTEGLDMLSKQLVSLRKKFTSYHDFAGKTVEEVLSEKMLKRANLLQVERLESGYLSNEDGRYSFKAFDRQLQVSPILSQLKHDFDGDGNEEVLVCGNYFGVQPYHGRFGSFDGALIKSNSEILSGKDIGLHLFNHSVRALNIIEVGAVNYLLVTVNDDSAQVYKIMKHK